MRTEKKTRIVGASVGIFLVALIILGLFVIVNKENKIEELNSRYNNLTSQYEERDSLVNEFNNTFDEIEKNLTFVQNKRSQLSIDKQEGNPTKKETLVADIKLMNTMLEESSKKIDDLEAKLKASGIDIKGFKNKIAQLNKSVEEQNASIEKFKSELQMRDNQIAELGEKLGTMEADIQAKDNTLQLKNDTLKMRSEVITETQNEMNKAYFASGTFKELKDNGVVEKDGGFLFLGREEKIPSNFNEKYFTELDKRSTDVFPIFSKKAEVISQHPDSSYKYIYEGDQIAYLKIENPEEFWKLTKYAVVQVK
jgi:peptidoglycan hydrolase CwlO-like protein